ncbi:hypothetical protein [Parafrankia discariae]|uniref:hypothetical protein n=1 Tax=Parafrankia discariae TaxID=365528 RepID=UPI00039EB5A1|nr:hypothetical protein [Parafrankia discariae]
MNSYSVGAASLDAASLNIASAHTVSARGSRRSGCRAALDEARGVLGFDSPKCTCVDESEHSARIALAVRDLDGQGVLRLALRAIADRVHPRRTTRA